MKFNIFESNEQKTLQMNLIGQNNIFKDLQKEIENPEIHEITFVLLGTPYPGNGVPMSGSATAVLSNKPHQL